MNMKRQEMGYDESQSIIGSTSLSLSLISEGLPPPELIRDAERNQMLLKC